MSEIESTATEIVAVDARRPIIAGATPAEITEHAEAIAQHLKSVIDERGLAVRMGTDRDGRPREHVTVEGWQAMGALLSAHGGQPLHADTVWARRMLRDDGEIAYEARVEVRTLAGDVVGTAESMCSNRERDRRGAAEHAIRSMAETRAAVRAFRAAAGWLVSLAGYATTPAEEMAEAVEAAGGTLPHWAEPASDEALQHAAVALLAVLKPLGAQQAVPAIAAHVRAECGGEIPLCVASLLLELGGAVSAPESAPNGTGDAAATDPPSTADTSAESPS